MNSQNFGNLNNHWIYEINSLDDLKFIEFRIIGDTVVNNIDSKKVQKTLISYIGEPGNLSRIDDLNLGIDIWSNQNGVIYRWKNNDFKLLFPLNPNQSENFEIELSEEYPCSSNSIGNVSVFTVYAESVQQTFSGDINYNQLDYNNEDVTIGSKLYSNIGPSFSPYPIPSSNCSGIDANLDIPARLVCFSDGLGYNITLNQSYLPTVCTEQLLSTQSVESNLRDTWIYPNPVQNILYFNKEYKDIRVYSVTGIVLKYENLDQLDVSELLKGNYLISLDGKSLKFIKRN